MKKISLFPRSFWMKVTFALILSSVLVGALSNFLIYRFTLTFQFNELRNKLMIIAQTAALFIDADTLLSVPLNREGIHSPQYHMIAEELRKIKMANPPLHYIYTMRKTEKEGLWQFIVDPDTLVVDPRNPGPTSYPGDPYDASRFPEMLKAFEGPSADKKLSADEWGVFYRAMRRSVIKAAGRWLYWE